MPLAGLVLCLMMANTVSAADTTPIPLATRTPIERQYNVVYAEVGGEKLRLDLARPRTGGPFPCVVCLHGGAWKMGSRKDLSEPFGEVSFGIPGASLIEVLADRGFAAVSVSYRLAPRHQFPAQIHDAKAAVRFLRSQAAQLRIDPNRIAALGFSAGGHLAALLGTTGAAEDRVFGGTLFPHVKSDVACVVDFFGPSDLTLYSQTPGIEEIFFRPLLGALFQDNPTVYKKASPLNHVSADDPPFLLIHGTADLVVPIIHSERLHKKLRATGVESALLSLSGKGHGWSGEDMIQSTDATVKFLSKHLSEKPQ
ncbi:MAG: alpha/beta hydrolase [Bacteroidales bacterium]|nr:alpha/beta hydrolase [Bacteroidales bacterium]